ncbi:hypothetical protein [Pseudomonas glycinae]|uniref:Uncharacterized protein n=1 Tax=Pseudomonas glycinae TaxID=1785145 RepID=A0ABN5FMW4_9PSED|nr:hypothetical protein [Pseudomonas glycinae]AUG97411.1 hypothetical protein AWU82_28420 [Pseudomonas glycinae]
MLSEEQQAELDAAVPGLTRPELSVLIVEYKRQIERPGAAAVARWYRTIEYLPTDEQLAKRRCCRPWSDPFSEAMRRY